MLLPIPPRLLDAGLTLAGKATLRESLLGSLAADISKARATSWRPQLSLEEGLRLALGAEPT